jgi:hypothetical protein
MASADDVVAAAAVDRIVTAIAKVDRIITSACGDKDVVIPSGHVQSGAVVVQDDRFQIRIRLDACRVGYVQNLDHRRHRPASERP